MSAPATKNLWEGIKADVIETMNEFGETLKAEHRTRVLELAELSNQVTVDALAGIDTTVAQRAMVASFLSMSYRVEQAAALAALRLVAEAYRNVIFGGIGLIASL